jgi:PAS domain S-box-containing protein
MYLPQYAKGALLDTPAQRRQALRGYIYSPFRMNDLMQGILGNDAHASDIDLEIFDGDTISFHNMMYDSDGAISGVTPYQLRKFSNVQTIDMLGHPWTLSITSTREFEQGIDHAKPLIVALAGIIISFLVFTVTWSLSIHRWRAQELAKRMTTALQEQEQEALTRAIVKDAADGILTIDSAGNILSFNRTAEHIFGYSADEVLGNNINMLMPEPFHSEHNDYLQKYLTSGQKKIIGVGREVSGKRKGGEIFTMDLAVSEVNLSQARRIFSGIVRDISKRKQVEEALRQSEERFDLAIRGANDGLWDWDLKHQTVYFSPRWKVMLGYTEEEILNTPEEWRKRIHPDDLNRVMEDIKRCLDGHTTHYQNEHRMLHKHGHYLWVLDRGIAQRDEQGNPYRMVGILSDISKHKKMDQLKSEFVSTVSHELRTPLTSIRGSLGLIAGGVTGPLPDQAKELIDIAYKNTGRLLTLINDILDIEKIQSGKMDFNFKQQALMPLIQQAIEANAAYASQYHVNFRLISGLPGAMVNVDADRLIQVMSNLLSNAAKFSHAGGNIDIKLSRNNNDFRVAISDHGVGIAESFHEQIFQKFTQADSSDTRHKGGTGLGLNISRSIIESMHGEIGFNSKIGAGTTFHIT